MIVFTVYYVLTVCVPGIYCVFTVCFRRVVAVRRRERVSAVTSEAAGRRSTSPAGGNSSSSPSLLDSSREFRPYIQHFYLISHVFSASQICPGFFVVDKTFEYVTLETFYEPNH